METLSKQTLDEEQRQVAINQDGVFFPCNIIVKMFVVKIQGGKITFVPIIYTRTHLFKKNKTTA